MEDLAPQAFRELPWNRLRAVVFKGQDSRGTRALLEDKGKRKKGCENRNISESEGLPGDLKVFESYLSLWPKATYV